MHKSFSQFLETYLDVWRNSSLTDLKNLISKDYEAREISGGNIVDFGYENNARWNIKVISILPLREDETMVILSASLILQGKSLETANLFFQTFKKNSINDWKLVRSYIEAGLPYISTNGLLFN